jgi:hypothetical protein
VPTFDDLAEKKEQLVRKPLDGSCFRAALTAEHIDESNLFDTDGSLLALPTGYQDLGLLNPDGMAFSRDINTSDVMAFGRQTPVRSDVTSDSTTLAVTAIETNLTTIELGTGATLLPGSRSTTTGALQIKKPPRPTPKQYHFLGVAVDLTEDGELYVCRYLPKGKITGYGDQAFGGTDDPIGWNCTITSQFDGDFGASEAWLFGGPGWNALLVDMGFTAYTPAP